MGLELSKSLHPVNIGWGFYLGPFELTWSFAHQLPNTVQVCNAPDISYSTCTLERIESGKDPPDNRAVGSGSDLSAAVRGSG